jgi:sarcosine/dimethylglycine N-methyltransferase
MTGKSAEETAKSAYLAAFDSAVSRFVDTMWGGHWHLGAFESEEDSLLEAQLHANRIMADAARLNAGQEVLEVACGTGGTARFLVKEYDVNVVATNISEVQLEEARRATATEGLTDKISYQFADYHDLPFASGRFDCWWCQEALLYSVNKRKVIEEAQRVVKPGGMLVLSDLTLDSRLASHERAEFQTAMKTNFWTLSQLDALISDMNLAVTRRDDLSRHASRTYRRLLESLQRIESSFRPVIGDEAVDKTLFRVRRQFELARDGHLGWVFYAIRN